jgi:phosphatidylserine/phosphatidylglycerophosphate/cardiolipin synthase-like enzyme
MVVEGDYLRNPKVVADPFKPSGKTEVNRELQNAILRCAVNLRSDYNSKIFHQKFVVRDGSAVLTGSTNFTDTGVTTNLNHVVIIQDRKVATEYGKEFREIQQGRFGKRSVGRGEKPKDVVVSNVPMRILFAPDHAPEMEIMKQMLKASKRIDFAMFTFAQSSGIDDVMMERTRNRFPIRGALDGTQANQRWAATRPVRDAGAKLHIIKKQAGLGKLHHKLMVIDKQVVIVGSFNYTGPANRFNDENIIVIGDLESTKKRSIARQKKLAGFAFKEIDRIIKRFG